MIQNLLHQFLLGHVQFPFQAEGSVVVGEVSDVLLWPLENNASDLLDRTLGMALSQAGRR